MLCRSLEGSSWMACALAPTPEIPSRAQRTQSAANEARPPCPAPAPLKVKLKIKIGGKLADKKGEQCAVDDCAVLPCSLQVSARGMVALCPA